jgi:hypothetical protein
MIQKVLETLCSELDHFLRRRHGVVEKKVVLSPLVDDAGHAILGKNKLLCTLIGTQQAAFKPSVMPKTEGRKAPPLFLELHLQFTASFAKQNYDEALAYLTDTLGFFQGKAVFTPENTPGLPIALNKVIMEPLELEPNILSQLWLAQGVPLQPALHYRCRLALVTEDMILGEVPAITGVPQLDQGAETEGGSGAS